MRTLTLTLPICAVLFGAASTAQVPTLLKDINPTGNSNVNNLTCFGDVVYFNATDGVNGSELWKTDGTEAGTVMVKDINVGAGSGFPATFMEMNGVIYFSATDGVNGLQLWSTDGTESGTQVVLSLADVTGLIDWAEFAALGDRIFFRGRDALHGSELWSTDGTAAGTQLFLDIEPGTLNSGMDDPLAFNGNLYFEAANATYGAEPWISDGTVAGTHILKDIIPGSGSTGTSPTLFTAAGGLVYFRAATPSTGDELWVTDGTEAGTNLVRDIYPGPNTSFPSYLIEHNGQLHLRAFPTAGSSTALIWQSDGTQAGTVSLPTFGYTNPDNICSHDGSLYFTAVGAGNRQLWRTDGTAPGTTEILFPGSDVISPFSGAAPMLSCNGDLYFRANYMTATGQELYTLNLPTGTEEHTGDITQLYPNPVMDRLVVQMAEPTNAKLLDNSGRVVRSWRLAVGSSTLELAGLASGTYMLVTETSAQRIMKQ